MAERGAPLGNKNATKAKPWQRAILRAVRKRSPSAELEYLDKLAEELLDACAKQDLPALKELGDRLDGKSHQSVDVGNPDGTSLFSKVERVIIETT